MNLSKKIVLCVVTYLIICGLCKFWIEPTIANMPCIDLSEDEREKYIDTWPPQ